jgi:hypothetical protein
MTRSYPEPKLPETTEGKKEAQKEASQTKPIFTTCDGSPVRTDQGDSATAWPLTHPPHHGELL